MTIDFQCPHCGMRVQVAEQFAGQTGPCKRCDRSRRDKSKPEASALKLRYLRFRPENQNPKRQRGEFKASLSLGFRIQIQSAQLQRA